MVVAAVLAEIDGIDPEFANLIEAALIAERILVHQTMEAVKIYSDFHLLNLPLVFLLF